MLFCFATQGRRGCLIGPYLQRFQCLRPLIDKSPQKGFTDEVRADSTASTYQSTEHTQCPSNSP